MEMDFYNVFMSSNVVLQSLFVIGFVLSLVALVFREQILLRALLMTGTILLLLYTLLTHFPLLSSVLLLILLFNMPQFISHIMEYFSLGLPEEWRPIYNEVFGLMRPSEFLNFMRLGEKLIISKNRQEFIFHQGDEKDVLLFILKGEVSIEKDNKAIARLGKYAFVGEMHYLTKQPMSADVRVVEEVTVLRWYHEQLDRLKMNHPETYANFLGVLSQDLVYKIQNTPIGNQGD